jgi:hypothetical protein
MNVVTNDKRMGKRKEFCPIKLMKAIRNKVIDANYLVYKTKAESVPVKAISAFEAIALSGIEKPIKVVHITPHIESFLEEEDLKFIQEDDGTVIEKTSSETVKDTAKTPNLATDNKNP